MEDDPQQPDYNGEAYEEERKLEPADENDYEEIKVIAVDEPDDVIDQGKAHLHRYSEQAEYDQLFSDVEQKAKHSANSMRVSLYNIEDLQEKQEEIVRGCAPKTNKISIKDFEIQGVLGEGAFGKVYCAVQKGQSKVCAIKVLDKYHIMKVSRNND